jgi:hypothetical protein
LKLNISPLTPDRWNDLEKLFGQKGACGGCWCMFWRLRRKDFEKRNSKINRSDFKEIVEEDRKPGYQGDQIDVKTKLKDSSN